MKQVIFILLFILSNNYLSWSQKNSTYSTFNNSNNLIYILEELSPFDVFAEQELSYDLVINSFLSLNKYYIHEEIQNNILIHEELSNFQNHLILFFIDLPPPNKF